MRLSNGQKLALLQLQSIESESQNDFEILKLREYKYNTEYVEIVVSLSTRSYKKKQDGFKFRPRERFIILVHKNFPFEIAKVNFDDFRFMGKPHVQWGQEICMYQSIEIDYDPADGMYGFIERLHLWLQKASIDDLDPIEAPLHPPVAYTFNKDVPNIIPNINTPDFEDEYWFGACRFQNLNHNTLIINEWIKTEDVKKDFYGAVLLMNKPMPFEYPFTLDHLFLILKNNQIDLKRFIENLGTIALKNGKDTPLFIVVGSQMRGLTIDRKQHLAVWQLNVHYASSLRTIFNTKETSRSKQKVKKHIDRLEEFSKKSFLEWCPVLENRPEIIVERDQNTVSEFFKGKTIEIWGCGALGSHIAEIIVRAKPKKIILIDIGIVKPGLILRQLFNEDDIGENKAEALKNNLSKIYSKLTNVEIISRNVNVLDHIDTISDNYSVDIIIDATASIRVLRKIDILCNNNSKLPILSYAINHDAKKAMIVYKAASSKTGITDIIRKSKLRLCENNDIEWLSNFIKFDESKFKLFQPEPGCSDPTFIGSEADLYALSGLLVNQGIKALLNEKDKSKVVFLSQELDNKKQIHYEQFSFENNPNDKYLEDPINGYRIFLPSSVLDKILSEIKKSDNKFSPPHETGGLLFGEWDDLSKIVYLNEASAAPEDSTSAPMHFECGIKGTKELNDQFKVKYKNSVYFIGLWHSHPYGSSQFSGEDKLSMQLVVTKLSPPKSLLLIIAYDKEKHSLGCSVFNKSQFQN